MKCVHVNFRWLFNGLFLYTVCISSARAQQPDIDPKLVEALMQDGMTKKPIHPSAAANPNLNPDISLIMSTGLGWFTHADHIQQGGHSMDENGLHLQGLELAAGASVDPYFRFDLSFELTHLHLEEAYLTSLSLPWNLQIRAGYFNAAFGRHNPLHLHSWKFINPPLYHSRFMAEEHFAGTGLELSALLPLPWYLTVTLEIFDTTLGGGMRTHTFGRAEHTQSSRLDGPEDFVYVTRLESFFDLSADWSILWGLSGAWGQSPYVQDNRATLYGTDLFVQWRPISTGDDALALMLTIEYLVRDTQVPGDSVRDHGGYLQLDIQWTRRWTTGVRFENIDLLWGIPPNSHDFLDWQWRGSLVAAFAPTHFSRLKLQYDLGREPGMDTIHQAVFLQVEVSTGAHGAHRF